MASRRLAAVSVVALLAIIFRRALVRQFVAVTGSMVRSERP